MISKCIRFSVAGSLFISLLVLGLSACDLAKNMDLIPPDPPTGLAAAWGPGTPPNIAISWDSSIGAKSYTLSRSAIGSGGPFSKVHTGVSTNYVDTGLNIGSTYWYEVTATNGAGTSLPSEVVQVVPNMVTLTITSGAGGTVSPTGAQTVTQGAAFNITAAANTDYGFVNWTKQSGAGRVVFADANNATTTVTVTGGDATIQANFGLLVTLTIIPGAGGTVSPSNPQRVTSGVAYSVSAIANPNYGFVNWTQQSGPGTVTFDNVNSAGTTVTVTGGDATIRANFAPVYTLTITAGTGGTVSPSGAQSVTAGTAFDISATATANYAFVNWTKVSGAGSAAFVDANSSGTTVAVTGGDVTIQANFTYVGPVTYTLTITAGTGGSVSPSGAQSVTSGVAFNISATANTNYSFVNWTKVSGAGSAALVDANSSGTTVAVTGGDVTIQANFTYVGPVTYTLTITAGTGGSVSPSGARSVTAGVAFDISATANTNYSFVNWTKITGAGSVAFADANSAGTNVTVTGGDVTIQANFQPTSVPPGSVIVTIQ